MGLLENIHPGGTIEFDREDLFQIGGHRWRSQTQLLFEISEERFLVQGRIDEGIAIFGRDVIVEIVAEAT